MICAVRHLKLCKLNLSHLISTPFYFLTSDVTERSENTIVSYTLLSGINLWFTDRCSTHDNNRLLFHSGFTLLHSRLEKAFIYFQYQGFTAVRRETAASSVLCVLISRTWCPGSVSAAGTNITGLSAPQQHPAQTYLHPSEQHLLFTVTSDCVVAGGGDQYSSVLVTLTWPGCPVRA